MGLRKVLISNPIYLPFFCLPCVSFPSLLMYVLSDFNRGCLAPPAYGPRTSLWFPLHLKRQAGSVLGVTFTRDPELTKNRRLELKSLTPALFQIKSTQRWNVEIIYRLQPRFPKACRISDPHSICQLKCPNTFILFLSSDHPDRPPLYRVSKRSFCGDQQTF